ncbi:MAG: MerR family transcriptional regulator [Candidatus Omnitrophota bacterium]|nr:MerR family transcriptional regulator [Candidatus Omnitrophota bacterium]
MRKVRKQIQPCFDIDIPQDEPVFSLNVVCELLHLHYWTMHEILQEGIVEPKKRGKSKKLFSYQDVKRLKYIKYLIEDKGVNIKGIKVILEMSNET